MTTRQKVARSLIPAVILAILALLLARPVFSLAADPAVLPADMLELLPPEAHLLVTVASLEAVDQQWQEVTQIISDVDPDVDVLEIDLLALLELTVPDLMAGVNRDRPLAVALTLPPAFSQAKASLIAVLPLGQEVADLSIFPPQVIVLGQKQQGDYLALYMEEPSETPGSPFWESDQKSEQVCNLAGNIPVGAVGFALDLQTIVAMYQPLIDMGLGALAMQGSAPADSTTAGPAKMPTFSPEMITRFGELVRAYLGSLDKLGVAFSLKDGWVEKEVLFTPVPGSALEPVDQPDFASALELTGLLPPGGSGLYVSAWDPGPTGDLVKEFYGLYIELLAQMAPDMELDTMAAWLQGYMDVALGMMKGTAGKYFISDEGMRTCCAMACPDPLVVQQQMDSLIEGLGNLKMGYIPQEIAPPFEGGSSWSFAFDLEQMMSTWGGMMEAAADSLAQPQPPTGELEEMMQLFMPGLHLQAAGTALLMTLEPDTERLAGMLKASRQSRLAVDPEAARLARLAGPDCLMITTMDLGGIFSMMPMMTTMMGSPLPFPDTGESEPIQMTSYLALDDGTFRANVSFDLAGYLRQMSSLQKAMMPQDSPSDCLDEQEAQGDQENQDVNE